MIRNLYIITILILLSFKLNAQTTVTGFVTDSLNRPIPFASVYLSKTTIGTLTDNEGSYSLTIPFNGVYELISSSIGYKSTSQTIFSAGGIQKINIKLFLKLIQLNEVTIKSKDKNRLKNLTLFTRLFLGATANAQYCKLTNPEDLHLYYDTPNKTLKGFSTKPLKIENKALGYIVVYDLNDFTYNSETGFLRFSGNPYFQLIDGSSKHNKRTYKNRLIAYYGSRLHLLRAIFSESLSGENFIISECKLDSTTKECMEISPVSVRSIVQSHSHNYQTLFSPYPIFIKYNENHPELVTGLTGFQSQVYESTIQFSDTVKLYQNGYFEEPYFLTWGGEMANERIADMLPFDFIPDEIANSYNSEETRVLTPLDNYVLHQQNSLSPDQIFVHLDRNVYKPSDTIFFQTYIRDRFTNDFESKSILLYALLFDFNNMMVDSARFKIDNATSSGWMVIPPNSESGKYHFTAFTSNMQNFDSEVAFHTDISIRSIVKTQPQQIVTDNQVFELTFLPEGGSLVQGIEQRVGFNATNSRGLPLIIKGLLKTENGIIIDTIGSGIFGPGFFRCTPQSGMYVQLFNGDNLNKKWLLPDLVSNTIALSVKPLSNRSFSIEIQSDNYTGDSITVLGVMNCTQIFLQDFELDKKQRIVVETDHLPSGVAQITVFNSEMRPIGERLLHINADKRLNFKISSNLDAYKTSQETDLTITITNGQGDPVEGIFSIAVVDSLSGFDAEILSPNIENSFNYYPNFLNNLPPKVLAFGIENLTEEDRDLIFMVYGWSRYRWDFIENEEKIKELVNYDLLNIKIHSSPIKQKSGNNLNLIALEGADIIHLSLKDSEEIYLSLDSLPQNTRTITLIPDNKDRKVVRGAILSIPFSEEYFKSIKLKRPKQSITLDEYPIPAKNNFLSIGDNVIEIPEVTIHGRISSDKVYPNIYVERYKFTNIKTSDPELIKKTIFLETAIRTIANPILITDEAVYFRPPKSLFGGNVAALIVLDGMPIYSQGWQIAKSIPMREISTISVLKGNQGKTIYGLEASGGVIFIETTIHDPTLSNFQKDWRTQNKKDNLLIPISLYRSTKEFYIPTKFEIENDPIFQNRSTIFWAPETYFNSSQPIKIKYTNPNQAGSVLIRINGVSTTNLIGTGSSSYRIK
jgi:hypothetical protein